MIRPNAELQAMVNFTSNAALVVCVSLYSWASWNVLGQPPFEVLLVAYLIAAALFVTRFFVPLPRNNRRMLGADQSHAI